MIFSHFNAHYRVLNNSTDLKKITTWSDSSHDSSGGFQDGFIDGPLVWSELAVGWEGAGDV